MTRPDSVRIVEVGPRDGLQNESQTVSVQDKIHFIELLAAAGLKEIEVGAFVSPKWVPQMATTTEVLTGIRHLGDKFTPSVLVPHEAGMVAALAAGVHKIAVFTAASETFNQKNIHCSIDESFERFAPVLKIARENRVSVRGYVSTAFVCPYEGRIAPEKTIVVVKRLEDAGVEEISIGDTLGQATPLHVDRLLDSLLKKVSAAVLSMHFHDTYGAAIANVAASLAFGISRFDASSAGLGGCPYAPGAAGNLATDDLVWFLHEEGIHTGVDLQLLHQAGLFIQRILGRRLPSKVLAARSGPS